MDDISELRAFLETQPRGPILETYRLVQLLSYCWHEFEGSSKTSMKWDKSWRIEEPEWHPPILSFSIEDTVKRSWVLSEPRFRNGV